MSKETFKEGVAFHEGRYVIEKSIQDGEFGNTYIVSDSESKIK